MKKRILIIFVIIALINVPISCDDDCSGFTLLEAKITELTSTIGTYESSVFSNSISNDFERAAINIMISNMEYSEISQTLERNNSIINAAYACSPPDPEPTQAINSIQITSESAVYSGNQEYMSGEDLVELFKVSRFFYSDDETSVNEFILRQNDDFWVFGLMSSNAVFQLLNQPDSSINQKFKFRFEFSDAEVIEVETAIFEIEI